MLLLIISFLVIAVYTAAVCIKAKGVPYSISATYYTLDHKLIFGASMALTAILPYIPGHLGNEYNLYYAVAGDRSLYRFDWCRFGS